MTQQSPVTSVPDEGSPSFAEPRHLLPDSSRAEIDAALQTLQAHKAIWQRVSVPERIALLEQLADDFAAIMEQWVTVSLEAKGLAADAPQASEEWGFAGPLLRYLRVLQRSLRDIAQHGRPQIPGPITTYKKQYVVAQVFPQTFSDRIIFPGITGEVWMQPDVTLESLADTQAAAYRNSPGDGAVTLVLGAGNVSTLGPFDVLYKLFIENKVVAFKANPVNAYLGPLIEQAFRALIERGFVQIIYGGAAEGQYLVQHDLVDELHMTGSDKTFETIVFGTGDEGARRKRERQPLITKPFTAELGNVSPVIVIPGPWSQSDIDYQAEHIASMIVNNAGFNCITARVIVQHAEWPQRYDLLTGVRRVLARIPTRNAYYPGASERQAAFVAAHPQADQFGSPQANHLPWTLIANVDSSRTDDICFTSEAFCGLCAETTLSARSVTDYIERAVHFANDHIWGTLGAVILVHPQSLRDPEVAAMVEWAIANLRYGMVCVNLWTVWNYGLFTTTWGGIAGQNIDDIQSGIGVINNTLMFGKPLKSVARGAFRLPIKLPTLASHTNAAAILRRVARYYTDPTPLKLAGIVAASLKR